MPQRVLNSVGILTVLMAVALAPAVTAQASKAAAKTKAARQTQTSATAKTSAAPKPVKAAKSGLATPKPAEPAKAGFRTPWGDPDLQGVWNDATSTPLQRPGGLAKQVLTDEEAADFQEEVATDLTRDRRDGGADADVARAYNDHWMDARRLKITDDHRTSLIVDPPDGKIPPLVPLPPDREKARAARQAVANRFIFNLPAGPEDLSQSLRCIIRTDQPPYLPTIYNNDFQIFQSPGYVVIAPEMIHSARVIPLDGRPHLGRQLGQWLGDTRGHWEGQTLVIETTNFRNEDGSVFMGGNPATYKITERFTRVAADTINYEFTIEDPETWTKPWTAVIPWTKIDPAEQMYEYACHEDNYDMVHILTAARFREKNGETAAPARPPKPANY